jgi:hypothetical protein
MIRHLSQRHEVTVASLARSPEEAKEGEGISAHCHAYHVGVIGPAAAMARMVVRLPTPVPSSMGYFYSPDLARAVRAELARTRFDLIFVHCSTAAQYVAHVRDIPKILDFGDMDSQKWLEYAGVKRFPLSLGYRLEGRKLRRAEMNLARGFELCTCTTRAEFDTLESYRTGTPADWFPNGVDLEFFTPTDGPYDADALVFVGRMDYFPNQDAMNDFCANVLPRVQAERPRTTLAIVGAEPPEQIRRLGELPGVTVTGTVPDVRDHVRRAAVAVAPLNVARGTQNKILECMAMGVPVVSSAIAAPGIDAVAGEHLLVASRPGDHAAAVLRLLGNRGERERFARAGRARVESHHSWSASMRRLDGIIEGCLKRWSARQPDTERAPGVGAEI